MKSRLLISILIILSILFLSSQSTIVFAQDIVIGSVAYSAKFICAPKKRKDDRGVTSGVYMSSINIHNHHDIPVKFQKRVVIANPQYEERGRISQPVDESLNPYESFCVDCRDIYGLLGIPPFQYIEGFVMLRQPADKPPLDVVGVYTVRELDGQGVSIDVEEYEPKKVASIVPVLPDLTAVIHSVTVNCQVPGVVGCMHTVDFEVINQGAAYIDSFFDVFVELDIGPSTTITVSVPGGIAPGGIVPLTVELGPSNNCYDPDCGVKVIVDSNSVIIESDETNNMVDELFIG